MTDLSDSAKERQRIAALRRYEILDTPPEAAFDRLAELASLVFGTPLALVSLIDDDRQWFKARIGVDLTETPRDWAFCNHTILNADQPLVVNDATRDDRFRENPLVTGDFALRFYVGAPIVTSDGQALGAVCAMDRTPRDAVSARDLATLQALAAIAADEMELRLTLGSLAREMEAREAAQVETLAAEKARARAETEMLRLRTGETLGRLTGGIAHEFNNLFAGMMLAGEMLAEDLAAAGQARDDVRGILTGIERGAQLTSRLMSYSRIQLLRPTVIEVEDALITAAEMLLVGRASEMDIEVEVPGDIWRIYADPRNLLAALVDLAANAWEASRPDMARIVISARNLSLDAEAAAALTGGRPGDFVRIDVRDEGRGMSLEVLAHAAEPFFTTKQVGEGPGLGLSMVDGFTRQSGGFMTLATMEGRGTTVSLFMPRAEAAEA